MQDEATPPDTPDPLAGQDTPPPPTRPECAPSPFRSPTAWRRCRHPTGPSACPAGPATSSASRTPARRWPASMACTTKTVAVSPALSATPQRSGPSGRWQAGPVPPRHQPARDAAAGPCS